MKDYQSVDISVKAKHNKTSWKRWQTSDAFNEYMLIQTYCIYVNVLTCKTETPIQPENQTLTIQWTEKTYIF